MLSKYMKMDSIPWLIDGENPAVTYLVKSEILNISDKEQVYKELLNSDLNFYFQKNYSNGILGDFKHLDLFYHGSIWFFLLAVESGYNCNSDFIITTAERLCKKTQLENGGFKFNNKTSDAVGCRTGSMVYSLLKSGISDYSSGKGIEWIVKNQRNDGGWLHCPVAGFCDVMKLIFLNKSGNGLKHEDDNEVASCPVASYSCLRALVESDRSEHKSSIQKGADFFINNNFFIRSGNNLFCGNRADFGKLGYPVMAQYDYLSGLILISQTGSGNSSKIGEWFNSIIMKQNNDGTWNCENKHQGMINQNSGKSRWTTLNAVRLISLISKHESQFDKA